MSAQMSAAPHRERASAQLVRTLASSPFGNQISTGSAHAPVRRSEWRAIQYVVEYFALLALPTMTIPRPRNAPFCARRVPKKCVYPFSEA